MPVLLFSLFLSREQVLEVSKDPEELELFRSECAEVAKVAEGTSDLQPVRDRQLARFNILSPSSIFSIRSNLVSNLLSTNY